MNSFSPTEVASIIPALPPVPEGWRFLLDNKNEWRPRDENHPSKKFVERYLAEPGAVLDWNLLHPSVNIVSIPVLYVRDPEGSSLADVRIEPRFVRVGVEPGEVFAVATQYWIVNRPFEAMELLKDGNYAAAMTEARKGESKLHRSIFLKARELKEIAEAMEAFKVLFQHYSFNEELWRLEKWMQEYLPFTLEEHPEMQKYKELLHAQVGHLRDGDFSANLNSSISSAAISKWYANGSPPADGIDENYAKLPQVSMRHKWLIDECRRLKYKRVAEWGSVNAVSLYSLINQAPDIDWYGFESNPQCIEAGIAVAKKAGFDVGGSFRLYPMKDFYRLGDYDAVSLFEVLEHNDPEGGAEIVADCLNALRPGGSLFITTPCGNWSGFDEHTRDLTLRKDHLNAYTPARMAKFLEAAVRGGSTGSFELKECYRLENPELLENNSWCHSRVERLR